MTPVERLKLLQWHLDRYDRLRASTTSRASVVLSAGAILSAGNAIVISQLLGEAGKHFGAWLLTVFTVVAMASAALVVLALIRASNVLVSLRDSRTMFVGQRPLPTGLVFNGSDTVAQLASFADFQSAVAAQDEPEVIEAAQVELWVCIQQHRHRYVRLRGAVRMLRYAAVAFLGLLAGAMVTNLAIKFW